MFLKFPVKFGLLLLLVCLFPQSVAHGLTLTDNIWVGACSPGWTPSDCILEQKAVCDGTIDIDKSSYQAGDSMTFSANVSSERYEPHLLDRWCKISFKSKDSDQNTPEFNVDPQRVYTSPSGFSIPYRYGPEMNYISQTLAGTVAATVKGRGEGSGMTANGMRTITVPALPSGNNYIRVGLMHENGLNVNNTGFITSGWGLLNFTVASAAPADCSCGADIRYTRSNDMQIDDFSCAPNSRLEVSGTNWCSAGGPPFPVLSAGQLRCVVDTAVCGSGGPTPSVDLRFQ